MIRRAAVEDCEVVTQLAVGLYNEIGHKLTEATARDVTRMLLTTESRYCAFLAFLPDLEEPVGLLTLAESSAAYAGGHFGVIQEFYVAPQCRSQGIGRDLLENARRFAATRGWKRLEVTAPFGSRFSRSVDFYRANGFEDSGPRLFVALTKG